MVTPNFLGGLPKKKAKEIVIEQPKLVSPLLAERLDAAKVQWVATQWQEQMR